MVADIQTAQFFHTYADDFNALYGNTQGLLNRAINRVFRKSMKLRYERTLEACQPCHNKRVLDVGTGPGHYAIALAQAGAHEVVGIDFADHMLELARAQAEQAHVASTCHFEQADFLSYTSEEPFDYVILMGFMDYMADPLKVIRKALALAQDTVVFSFPAEGGLLAFQRKLRYASRCPLYLYTEQQLRDLFSEATAAPFLIEPMDRDFFVSVYLKPKR